MLFFGFGAIMKLPDMNTTYGVFYQTLPRNQKGGDLMDIASLSTALSSITTGNDIGVAMLSKQLDLMETQGDSMVKALEQSVSPHLGSNIDVLV